MPRLRRPRLGAFQPLQVATIRLRHRDHYIVAEGIKRGPFLLLIGAAVIDTRYARRTPASAIRVDAVRRRSCNLQGFRPSRVSSAALALDQPEKPPLPSLNT
jgi:hypothetical protein